MSHCLLAVVVAVLNLAGPAIPRPDRPAPRIILVEVSAEDLGLVSSTEEPCDGYRRPFGLAPVYDPDVPQHCYDEFNLELLECYRQHEAAWCACDPTDENCLTNADAQFTQCNFDAILAFKECAEMND